MVRAGGPWVFLFLSAGLLRCESGEPATSPGALIAVVGIESRCAGQLRKIRLELGPGEPPSVLLDRPVPDRSAMPVAVPISLPQEGPPSLLTATFTTVDPSASPPSPRETRFELLLPAGSSGRVTLSTPCVCLGFPCPEGTSCRELPAGSGKATCVSTALCGDGVCEASEDAVICPADCAQQCGDGRCDPGETCDQDCPPNLAGAGGEAGQAGGGAGGEAGDGGGGGV